MNDAARPWLRRREWCEGVMRRRGSFVMPKRAIYVCITALVIGGILLRNWDYIWVYFMASIVALSIGPIAIMWPLSHRIGTVEFRFEEVPFIIGSKVRGMIVAPFRTDVGEYRSVRLR